MELSSIDATIIVVYFVAMIGIGVAVTRRAAQDLDSYFLAGNNIPWYVLGVSNASAMFDIAGTMWLVYNIVVYGMKGAYLPWLWPTFNQVIFMVYLAAWIRRSNVLTGAEWITTRFGDGRGGELCRLMVAIFALLTVVTLTAYAFVGIGKFCKTFLPWNLSADTYAMILMGVTAVYVILGGMLSVILTDLAQFAIMACCSVAIAFIAMRSVSIDEFNSLIPTGWYSVVVGPDLGLDWSSSIPQLLENVKGDGYTMFGAFFMVMLLKGVLVSIAGPAPNYDMQRILAARTPREAGLMSGIVSLALVPRWLMIGGFTLIGVVMVKKHLAVPELAQQWVIKGKLDFEMLLPLVMKHYIPAGLLGLLLAGLLAAFMSTFSATLNAGTVYLVNDVYKRYLAKGKSNRHYMLASYTGTFLVLMTGIYAGLHAESINTVTQWLLSGLFGGYTAANVLKWYWWRFNAYGYFWGMLTGIAIAGSQMFVAAPLQDWIGLPAHPLWYFPIILILSGIASVVGSLVTSPDNQATLERFYRSVRPWGAWGKIREAVMRSDPQFEPNRHALRDMFSCGIAIVWQFQLVLTPLFFVFQRWRDMLISLAIFIVTSWALKRSWLDVFERATDKPAQSPTQ